MLLALGCEGLPNKLLKLKAAPHGELNRRASRPWCCTTGAFIATCTLVVY
jgi:hypothetical protein